MPVNLSIKNAPDDVVQRLRERAARNHRSLQGELMAIIEEAARPTARLTPGEVSGAKSASWASGPRAKPQRSFGRTAMMDTATTKVVDASAFLPLLFDEPAATGRQLI